MAACKRSKMGRGEERKKKKDCYEKGRGFIEKKTFWVDPT